MVMFLARHPIEVIFLNSSDLLELTLLLLSTLAIYCKLRNFLIEVICLINFAKLFQNFTADAMIWYTISILDLNLSSEPEFYGDLVY